MMKNVCQNSQQCAMSSIICLFLFIYILMEFDNSDQHKFERTELTPAVKDKLVESWKHGMRTADSPIVLEAAASTGLSNEKIKKWISNYRGSLKIENNNTTTTKILRGTNGYNLFCSSLKHIEFSQFGMMWSNLTPEVKNEWNKKAKIMKKETDLQIKRRKKNNFTALKRITADFQQMGIPFGGLIIFEGSAEVFGDTISKSFLLGNPTFLSTFSEQHSQREDKPVHSDNVLSLRSEVRTIFNLKYSEAVGSTSKMPYSKMETFQVFGLPCEFKNPSNYGPSQCKEIIGCQHDIMVTINNQQNIPRPQVASVKETAVEIIDMVEAEDQHHARSIVHVDISESEDQEKWERALLGLIDE